MKEIYADNAATRSCFPEIKEQIQYCYNLNLGNASSLHKWGRNSRKVIEEARKEIADCINAEINEIFFTSGATESNNWAIQGWGKSYGKKYIVTSSVEHKSVLKVCDVLTGEGEKVKKINVDQDCRLDLDELIYMIENKKCQLVSIIYANNETGTIMPIKEIGEILKNKDVIFHTDATQAIGHLLIDVKKENIDLLSASAHKFGGPKGVGFLYCKNGMRRNKYIYGGEQEFSMRPGTENIVGIMAMGKALKLSLSRAAYNKKIETIKKQFEKKIMEEIDNVIIVGEKSNRLAGHSCICIKDVDNIKMVMELDKKGIYISGGSACDSGKILNSHVLQAMSIEDKFATGELRFSFDEDISIEDVNYIVTSLKEILEKER